MALDKSAAWVGPLKKDADLLGTEAMLGFRNEANKFAPFYKNEQLTRLVGFGCAGKYGQPEKSAADLAALLATYRNKLTERLEACFLLASSVSRARRSLSTVWQTAELNSIGVTCIYSAHPAA